jgi:hypothetical protein
MTAITCLSPILGIACSRGGSDTTELPSVVVAVEEIPEVLLHAGDSTTVIFPVLVSDGYHVQSNPASSEFYVPLALELEADSDMHIGRPEYPEGDPYYLEGTSDPLQTYEGRVPIRLTLGAASAASPGEYMIQGTLRYQACDSRRCLFPASVPVTLAVRVVQ